MTEFSFQILSPEKVIYKGNIVSLVVPGQEGYLGVMARHAPMIAALAAGEVKISEANGAINYYAVSGGILEVGDDEVVLLADSAEKADEINTDRAEAARKRAEERLAQREQEIDFDRAQAALLRAITRLRVARKYKDLS
jgi:F-type H+-transporting ATPase subunit epsilon